MKLTEWKEEKLKSEMFKYSEYDRETLKELVEAYFKKFDVDNVNCYEYFLQTHNPYTKKFYNEVFKIIQNWEEMSISPYSDSCYNSKKIGWGSKPEGSIRIADHWNFKSQGEIHCIIDDKAKEEHMLMCEYKDGKYYILRDFTEELGENNIYNFEYNW